MKVKKHYKIGDIVWVYGINSLSNKSTQGKVVHSFQMNGYADIFYVVAITTEIEDLLEVRTWQTISQTADGHVGSLREAFSDPDAAHKMLARTGMAIISTDEKFEGDGHDGMGSFDDEYEPSTEEIHAAMERAKQTSELPPLNLKDHKPKRRYFKKKPKA